MPWYQNHIVVQNSCILTKSVNFKSCTKMSFDSSISDCSENAGFSLGRCDSRVFFLPFSRQEHLLDFVLFSFRRAFVNVMLLFYHPPPLHSYFFLLSCFSLFFVSGACQSPSHLYTLVSPRVTERLEHLICVQEPHQ